MSQPQWGRAMDTAIDVVTSRMTTLEATAQQYSSELQAALGKLGDIKMADVAVPTRADTPKTPAPALALGAVPTFTPGQVRVPAMPGAPSIDSLLSDLSLDDLQLPDAPAMPGMVLPTAPTMREIAAPARPAIDTHVDIPTAPAITMPEMESLEQLTIPAFEFPQLPDFDGVPPSADHIVVPNVFINWAEPQYQSELLPDLVEWVKRYMLGGTGLPAPVEDALFGRARERESAEARRAVQEAVDTWAARGFTMPPGMLARQADMVREQSRLKAAELNRDILVEAAKWEQENIRFAVQQGMALEQLLQNLHENTAKRLFEVARFQAEAQINVFNAQIGLFNAQNQAFATLAQVFRTRLDGALAKLQAYKTAIEGQAALGQINQQRVEVFKAKLAGVQSAGEVFNAMMRGAQVRADVIKNQFDAYRADVQAYAEQVGAEKVKFDAFDSQMKGETARAGMFEASARAYAATVQGVAAKADVRVKSGQMRMEAARVHISKYLADLDAFKAQLEASLKEVQTGTANFGAQVEAWKAGAQMNVAASEMQSRYADMQTRTNIAFSEMQISQYSANITKAQQQAAIALEAAKAMGQYAAQLAAGAMSALNVSASVQGSGSQTDSVSYDTKFSTDTNYNYNYSS